MGSTQPNPPSHSRGGSKETYFTDQHNGGLVLCLGVSQWGCIAPPPFWCWAHQHLSRQSTQQKFLWGTQPAGGLPTPSLRQVGGIPWGLEWRIGTNVGHSTQATILGDGVHPQGHSTADNSPQSHPGRLSRSCLSMVINPSFFPTLCYRVSQQGSHWSQSDGGDSRPLVKPYVWNARGILHAQFPLETTTLWAPNPMATKEKNTPKPGEALQGYLKQPPSSPHGSSPVDTAKPHSPSQPLPLTWYSGEGQQPYSSPITGQLHQPVVQCTAPPRGNERHNGPSTLHQGHNGHAPPVETEVNHCQNEIDTSETIREIKAWHAVTIGEAEAAYGTAIRKAEAVHLASTSKVEVIQATGIRKAKATNAVWASKL